MAWATHRELSYRGNLEAGFGPDLRKWKHFLRKQGQLNQTQEAFYRGQHDGYFRKPRATPYPPGRRLDAYNYGYDNPE